MNDSLSRSAAGMSLEALIGPSRLPQVGTTIFTVMSQLAAQYAAVNLGQGFPDWDCAPELKALVAGAIDAGHNQYAPMAGVAALREQLALKQARLYGHEYDPDSEITITAGATQATDTTEASDSQTSGAGTATAPHHHHHGGGIWNALESLGSGNESVTSATASGTPSLSSTTTASAATPSTNAAPQALSAAIQQALQSYGSTAASSALKPLTL